MHLKKLLLLTYLVLAAAKLFATTLDEFGVRPNGMGGAYVAIANDESSLLWNPAGLAHVDASSLTLSQNRLSFDTRDYLVNLVIHPVPKAFSFGIAWTQGSEDNVVNSKIVTDSNGNPVIDPVTNLPQQQILNYYTRYTQQAVLGAGLAISNHLALGASLRGTFINQASDTVRSLTGDVGFISSAGNLSIGAAVLGMGTYPVGQSDGSVAFQKPFWRGGAGYQLGHLLGDLDAYFPPNFSNPPDIHGGLEYKVFEEFAVRCGYSASSFDFGLSLKSKAITLDYAVVPSQFSEANRIAVSVEF